jgi:hypothetical protein
MLTTLFGVRPGSVFLLDAGGAAAGAGAGMPSPDSLASPGSDVTDPELLAWIARVAVANELFTMAEVRVGLAMDHLPCVLLPSPSSLLCSALLLS